MDLQQLRTFTVIAREGSLSRAADQLFLSQPAISAQLKALESELRVKLFERTSKGMDLTFAGKSLLQEATNALAAANNVSVKARHLHGRVISGEFKLGTISEPIVLRLGNFLAALIDTYPDLRLSLSQGISGEIVSRTLNREVHAGYVIGDPQNPKIASVRIAPITLRIVAPAHWKDKLIDATWQDIVQFPWLSTPERCSFRQIASRMFARHNVRPQTVIETDQETLLSDLVAKGVGLSLLREDIAAAGEASGKLATWSPGVEIDHLYFIHLKDEEESPLLQAIMPLVRQVWKL